MLNPFTPEATVPAKKPGQCSFYNPKKKRFCPLQCKRGDPEPSFCPMHATNDPFQQHHPCPYDPKRCTGGTHLQKHLQTCNFRPTPDPEYISRGVNVTIGKRKRDGEPAKKTISTTPADRTLDDQGAVKKATTSRLSRLTSEEFKSFLQKLETVWTTITSSLTAQSQIETYYDLQVLTHPAFTQRIESGQSRHKHAHQISSLVAHLQVSNLLDKSHLYIEPGCGAAELSDWIHDVVGDPSRFVLLDKATCRWKAKDCHAPLETFVKVKSDMADIVLYELLRPRHALLDLDRLKDVVVVSKHLCGAATDLSLNAVLNYERDRVQKTDTLTVSGIMIALCCHHRCDLRIFPNAGFLLSKGLDERDFELLVAMSSWAVCNNAQSSSQIRKKGEEAVVNEPEEDNEHDLSTEDIGQGSHYSTLSENDRKRYGLLCKAIINEARADLLRQNGFKVKMTRYVPPNISPENVVLIATKE